MHSKNLLVSTYLVTFTVLDILILILLSDSCERLQNLNNFTAHKLHDIMFLRRFNSDTNDLVCIHLYISDVLIIISFCRLKISQWKSWLNHLIFLLGVSLMLTTISSGE